MKKRLVLLLLDNVPQCTKRGGLCATLDGIATTCYSYEANGRGAPKPATGELAQSGESAKLD